MKRLGLMIVAVGIAAMPDVHAQDPAGKTRLKEVVVSADEPQRAVLPDVDGAKIYAGKKSTVTNLKQLPEVQGNNYRQAFSQLPGLLVAEQTVQSHSNFNYRGVGDPHETEYLLVLKDGMPIVSDWFGYSTLYYNPPTETVDRIELVRGGSSLLYGPQPGPVLNYVTHLPPDGAALTGRMQHVFGSDGLYSQYHTLGGTRGPWGYLGYVSHKTVDGARPNADTTVLAAGAKAVLTADEASRWIFNLDAYESESGEAGRLSLSQYLANRDFTRTPADRIWIERIMPSVTYERELSDDTLLVSKSWAGYQDRFSRRQTGSATNLDEQEFSFIGSDMRLRHAWDAGSLDMTTTGGMTLYAADSPRSRKRGAELHATTGPTRFELDRRTLYAALFAEQLIKTGRLSVVPSARLDVIDMKVHELSNVEVVRPLITDSYTSVVPLGSLGIGYELDEANTVYANVAQGYRPKEYDDLVSPTSTQSSPSTLEESRTLTYEAGLRGSPRPWWSYDASYFVIDYRDYIETLSFGGGNTERSNSGRALYHGLELASEVDLIGLYDQLAAASYGPRWGRLHAYNNLSLLSAEFVGGSTEGRDPAYAPKYLVKTGLIYALHDTKIGLSGQFVGDHYWQDSNAAGTVGIAKIASYMVWDLQAETAVYKDIVRLVAGVNNLFDDDYYSRVRSDGIEPASRRTYYLGCSISF